MWSDVGKFAAAFAPKWMRDARAPYDPAMHAQTPRGPGLAKTKRPALARERVVHLLAGADGRWRELFDVADVVSEGASHGEGQARRYFGSTSILLGTGGALTPLELPLATKLASVDPHVRLRALRAARREAATRAGGPLGRVHAEISVRGVETGVIVHVDVEAEVAPERRALSRSSLLTRDADHANR